MRERSSEEYKQAVLKKLSESVLSFRQFAIEEGIAPATLHKWKQKYNIERPECSSNHLSDRWSPEDKFTAVLETATLSEIELSKYCRSKGLYPEQVMLWKQACIQGTMKKSDQQRKAELDAKSDKKRIKQLERELARKDKALAEAAALLVLGKKLDTLRQENEDD